MTWERQRAYDLEAGYEKGVKETAIANAKLLIADGRYSLEEVSKLLHIPEDTLRIAEAELKTES